MLGILNGLHDVEGTVQKAQNGTEWYRIGTEWYRMPKRHRTVQNKNVQKAQNGIE